MYCPGFDSGYILWNDEGTNNGNRHVTSTEGLPDGQYEDGVTLMYYCCRYVYIVITNTWFYSTFFVTLFLTGCYQGDIFAII